MRRWRVFWSVLAGLLLISGVAQAQIAIVAHYTSGNESFDVFTFKEDKIRTAGLGFHRKISLNVTKSDWSKIVALWQKAKNSQAGSFHPVGSFTETATKDPSTLTVAAGTGVRFTIDQPAYPNSKNTPGTFSFTILPKDFAKFDADLAKVEAFLASD